MNKYVFIVALGALSYGGLSSFAKVAYGQGYNTGEIAFAQAFIGMTVLWTIVGLRNLAGKKHKLTFNWKLLLAGTSIGLSSYTFYLSVAYIPVSLAIVLLMQVSWISTIIECFLFKKNIAKSELVIIFFIIVGTILAGNLTDFRNLSFSPAGVVLALFSACIYAAYVLFTSKLGNDTPMFEKSAMMMTGSTLIVFLINIKTIATGFHLDMGLLKFGIFLAVFGTIIPPICFTIGMPKIGPGLSAILLTLELPAVIFCAYIILGEKITAIQILGIMIMIGAIVYQNLAKLKKEKSMEEHTLSHVS